MLHTVLANLWLCQSGHQTREYPMMKQKSCIISTKHIPSSSAIILLYRDVQVSTFFLLHIPLQATVPYSNPLKSQPVLPHEGSCSQFCLQPRESAVLKGTHSGTSHYLNPRSEGERTDIHARAKSKQKGCQGLVVQSSTKYKENSVKKCKDKTPCLKSVKFIRLCLADISWPILLAGMQC